MKVSWVAGLMALALPIVAEAHDGFGFSVHIPLPSISIHGPGFYCGPGYCGPRYYGPPVVYAPPPVTYYAPAPVYAAPMYEAPAVVYGPPVVYGPSVSVYGGPRYYRSYGHRGYRR